MSRKRKHRPGLPPVNPSPPSPQQQPVTRARPQQESDGPDVQLTHAAWRGPLPPPSILAAYDEVLPGAAERILGLAEKESSHRHATQNKIADAQVADLPAARAEARRGQTFGLTVALAALVVAGVVTLWGHDTTGSIIGGATVVSLVTAFIVGRTGVKKDDRVEKKAAEQRQSNLSAKE